METKFNMFYETEVPENELIVSRTDLNGRITYVNETFANISGYEIEELVGQTHNIIRHPDMPKSTFKELWETIQSGNTWNGYVKNIRKDGGFYWVHAMVSSVLKDGKVVEYKSVREPISKAKTKEMQNLYDELRDTQENTTRVVLYINNDKIAQAINLEDS